MWIEADVQHWNPANEHLVWLLSWLIGALGNADILATFIRHRDTTNACLTNLIAGNILAILCLPVNYLRHFCRGCGLGFPMGEAFFISRDIAAGVQIFSVVVYSALKFSNVKSPDKYEAINASPRTNHTAVSTGHEDRRCVTAACLTFAVWTLAIFCSLPTALISEPSYYMYAGDMFEDTNAKRRVLFHCVTFCIIPQILIISLYILTKLRRRNTTDKMKDDGGKLVFWLACAIMINYVPLYTWLLCSWSQHRLLTLAVVDFATYFPLYSTACWTPVVLYFCPDNAKEAVSH
jgi:hypothetical protein